MAHQSLWIQTRINEKVIDCLGDQINPEVWEDGKVTDSVNSSGDVLKGKRDSKIGWVPTTHWISPLIWFYVERANRENFRFDINCIDYESLQFTVYSSNQFYGWHRDDCLSNKKTYLPANSNEIKPDWGNLTLQETTRKLSFSLILSDSSEYEGGQFQMLSQNDKMYEVPQEKGLLVIFDSTTKHRVRPIKKGIRKSLVGWVLGPRWR